MTLMIFTVPKISDIINVHIYLSYFYIILRNDIKILFLFQKFTTKSKILQEPRFSTNKEMKLFILNTFVPNRPRLATTVAVLVLDVS